MDSSSLMARLFAVAVLVVIGMGIFVFMKQQDLEAAQTKIATVEADRDKWQKSANQYVASNKTFTTNLDQCKVQVTDLQTQLEAANTKKPAAAPVRR